MGNMECRLRHPIRYIYTLAKARAKHRGMVFELEYNQYLGLVQSTKTCPILGIPLVYECFSGTGKGVTNPARASLDRIDSKLGYTKENTWIISWMANSMKNNLTIDEFKYYLREGYKWATTTQMQTDAAANSKPSSLSTGTGSPQISNLSLSLPTSVCEGKQESSFMTSELQELPF